MDSGDLNSVENLNIFNDEDSQPLFEGARVTTGAFMLLPALFTSKHRISGDGIQQLLQIVSLILPSTHNFSVSLQAFRDFFKHLKNPLKTLLLSFLFRIYRKFNGNNMFARKNSERRFHIFWRFQLSNKYAANSNKVDFMNNYKEDFINQQMKNIKTFMMALCIKIIL